MFSGFWRVLAHAGRSLMVEVVTTARGEAR
jgi:hypothetical protein